MSLLAVPNTQSVCSFDVGAKGFKFSSTSQFDALEFRQEFLC